MPTTIYDSSLITQRKRDKTISGSFINRIQNSKNPTTGSAPLLGISEQSIINTVKMGQMTQYQKSNGCVFISPGCPCNTVITPVMQDILWVTRIGGINADIGFGITTDATGVYVTGYFGGTVTIYNTPGIVSTVSNLVSSGSADAFIVKYDTSGTALWATRIGGINADDQGFGITTDATGVYVTGYFTGTATIYNTPGNVSTVSNLVSSGVQDAFIVKYDTSGTALWATRIGGINTDIGFGITTDATGVYVTGYFGGIATIYNTPGNVSTVSNLVSSGNVDAFIVKYDTSGTALWATRIGGINADGGYGITTDATGVYVTGFFSGTVTIYNTPGNVSTAFTLTGSGSYDAFIVKYDTNGYCVQVN